MEICHLRPVYRIYNSVILTSSTELISSNRMVTRMKSKKAILVKIRHFGSTA